MMIKLSQGFWFFFFLKKTFLLWADKAAADANAAAWAAYYAQYGQQPQAPMTPTSGAPGTTQSNGQGNVGHIVTALTLTVREADLVWPFIRNLRPAL